MLERLYTMRRCYNNAGSRIFFFLLFLFMRFFLPQEKTPRAGIMRLKLKRIKKTLPLTDIRRLYVGIILFFFFGLLK